MFYPSCRSYCNRRQVAKEKKIQEKSDRKKMLNDPEMLRHWRATLDYRSGKSMQSKMEEDSPLVG